jgi:lipoprotein-anchoring transpeptidase ErfK/SrfK
VDLNTAIDTALTYGRTVPVTAPVNVVLPQFVDRDQLRAVLEYRAKDVQVTPVDATLAFRKARPRVRPPRIGSFIDVTKSIPVVADALLTRLAPQVELAERRVRPARMTVGASVVVSRRNRTLTLFREEKRITTLRVAVGTSQYPTPRGQFSIVTKQRNPTWIPPDSPWAKGLGPIPPGPGNPLGTRWMGTSASAVGIHGTYASGTIGTAASHGCIRMHIRDSEWLYERVQVGTPVLIV